MPFDQSRLHTDHLPALNSRPALMPEFQPVWRLRGRQPAYPVALEAYGRLPSPRSHGSSIRARDFLETAARSQTISHIDRQVWRICRDMWLTEQSLSHPWGGLAVMMNVAPATLADPKYMRELNAFLHRHPEARKRIILEIPQYFFSALPLEARHVLSNLSALGVRFSMDQTNPQTLQSARPETLPIRYIKIPASRLVRVLLEPELRRTFSRMKRRWASEGIDIVATRVNRAAHLNISSRLEIEMVQGHFLG